MAKDQLHGRGARTNAGGRYERFAAFLKDGGLIETAPAVDDIAVEIR